jgi:hypothetical protein
MYGWLPPLSGGYFVEGFHYLDILPLALFACDPMLTWLEVKVFHHLVTVRTPARKDIDGYLTSLRHNSIAQNIFF